MKNFVFEQLDCAKVGLVEAKEGGTEVDVAYYEGKISAFELILTALVALGE